MNPRLFSSMLMLSLWTKILTTATAPSEESPTGETRDSDSARDDPSAQPTKFNLIRKGEGCQKDLDRNRIHEMFSILQAADLKTRREVVRLQDRRVRDLLEATAVDELVSWSPLKFDAVPRVEESLQNLVFLNPLRSGRTISMEASTTRPTGTTLSMNYPRNYKRMSFVGFMSSYY